MGWFPKILYKNTNLAWIRLKNFSYSPLKLVNYSNAILEKANIFYLRMDRQANKQFIFSTYLILK